MQCWQHRHRRSWRRCGGVFPDLGVLLVPWLVRSGDHAYKMFNGETGTASTRRFTKVPSWRYCSATFWNNRRPIVEPNDLRGLKVRVQPPTVFADTINGPGGFAVPMPFAEVAMEDRRMLRAAKIGCALNCRRAPGVTPACPVICCTRGSTGQLSASATAIRRIANQK
jgi:hypothetical protein